MKKIKYYKQKDKIIIEIPFQKKRTNAYMPDDADLGNYNTLTGIIMRHRKNDNDWDEIGFALTINMSYKGKPDQYTDIKFHFMGEEEEFKKLCKDLGIILVELNDNDL